MSKFVGLSLLCIKDVLNNQDLLERCRKVICFLCDIATAIHWARSKISTLLICGSIKVNVWRRDSSKLLRTCFVIHSRPINLNFGYFILHWQINKSGGEFTKLTLEGVTQIRHREHAYCSADSARSSLLVASASEITSFLQVCNKPHTGKGMQQTTHS